MQTLDKVLDGNYPATRPANPLGFKKWVDTKIDNYIAPIQEYDSWILPGRGKQNKLDCGMIRNVYSCEQKHVHIHRYFCMKRSCPICYPSWMNREAERLKDRLLAFVNTNKVNLYHYSLSLDEVYSDFDGNNVGRERYLQMGYDNFRKKVFRLFGKLLRKEEGYLAIFHPYRMVKGVWVYGPHFHVITYVDYVDNEKVQNLGLFVKRISFIETVKPLLCYELSHMGVREGGRSIFLKGNFYFMSSGGVIKTEKVALCKKCHTSKNIDSPMYKCKTEVLVATHENRTLYELTPTDEVLITKKKRIKWVCSSNIIRGMDSFKKNRQGYRFVGLRDFYHDPYVEDLESIDERKKLKERKKEELKKTCPNILDG